jgi:hypothetical protein
MKVAQDAVRQDGVLGRSREKRAQSLQGRLKSYVRVQPSLTGLLRIACISPGLTSWATFSRPFGAHADFFRSPFSRRGMLLPSKLRPKVQRPLAGILLWRRLLRGILWILPRPRSGSDRAGLVGSRSAPTPPARPYFHANFPLPVLTISSQQ